MVTAVSCSWLKVLSLTVYLFIPFIKCECGVKWREEKGVSILPAANYNLCVCVCVCVSVCVCV